MIKPAIGVALGLALCGQAVAQQPPLIAENAPLTADSAALVRNDGLGVDPARLLRARALVDVIMPPASRTTMIDTMMRGMMANLGGVIQTSPQMKALIANDPRIAAAVERFVTRQQEKSLSMLKSNFPGMLDAVAHAYARRFTDAQMADMDAFFQTPSGRAYIAKSATIMNDPDVARWQRDLMTGSMKSVPADLAALSAEIKALKPDVKK